MKAVFILFIILLLGSGVFYFWYMPSQKFQSASAHSSLKKISVGEKNLSVEVVSSSAQITLGLSGRDTIGSDGMLFVLPAEQRPYFWMKEMKIPLDFIWIDGDAVVDLTENVPAPDRETPESALPTYQPKVPVTQVLEVPAGSVSAWKIKIGNPVHNN